MPDSRPLSAAELRAEEFRRALVAEGASLISDDYLLKKALRQTLSAAEAKAGRQRAKTLRQLEKLKRRVTELVHQR